MVRTQVQLDNQTYETLRHIAHRRHASMSAVVREILHAHLAIPEGQTQPLLSFIAAGASGHRDTSLRHDEILAEALDDFS
jgi:plasmid stability protein